MISHITEELRLNAANDGREAVRTFQFTLCRKRTVLGDLEIDHLWMPHGSVYPDRRRSASNYHSLVDYFWSLCFANGTHTTPAVQQSYILAKLLPHARSNGARRVFADAVPTRARTLDAGSLRVAGELDQLLRRSAGAEMSAAEFRNRTADALGPPVYDSAVQERYRQMESELLDEGCAGLNGNGEPGLAVALARWQAWMASIGRRSGNERDKLILDVFSYECRAALHRCYATVWSVLIPHLTEKYGLSRESATFHALWHGDHCAEANDFDVARFHLFHGHIFALHAAAAEFILSQVGSNLIGEWTLNPSSSVHVHRLLHGLYLAIDNYARRNQVYQLLRKRQPDLISGCDLIRLEEQQEEIRRGRRRLPRRETDAS